MSTNSILFGALFVLVAIALFFIVRIEMRLNKIFKGKNAESLETLMRELVSHVEFLDGESTKHKGEISVLVERLKHQGHGIKIMRFNPFKDVGGTQSFAVGIVNEKGDGVVFSSLYSRDRMSVFAKPIANGTSDVELTTEESTVVDEARKDASR